ncbi:MAG TPA: hypothetical protein PLB96_02640 [Syntrophales bacterium]|nr:hypothetical protein [Syntrophales bacterium]
MDRRYERFYEKLSKDMPDWKEVYVDSFRKWLKKKGAYTDFCRSFDAFNVATTIEYFQKYKNLGDEEDDFDEIIEKTGLYELNNPFQNRVIRQWFSESLRACGCYDGRGNIFNGQAVTTGSEPFNEEDFDIFLRTFDIDCYRTNQDCEVLIVGSCNFDENAVLKHLRSREVEGVLVYSQEMAASYLFCGRDPYEDVEVLREYIKGHPAIQFCLRNGYDLPRQQYGMGVDTWDHQLLQKVGLLRYLGYHVGGKGKLPSERRDILSRALKCYLPVGKLPKYYLQEWGSPQSAERLKKMANSIATFIRNAKIKQKPPLQAIRDWETDLNWLRDEYYNGQFPWPSTNIYY